MPAASGAARWLPRPWLGLVAALLVPALHAQPHKEVLDRSAGYKDEALLLLERLVNIDSGSANTAASRRAAWSPVCTRSRS